MKKIDKKAFTLIELIVVIAVIGILVLLAVPRFIGHSQRAELARIQHDVKVMEQEIGTEFINNDDDFNKWGNNIKYLNQLVQNNELFEKKGPVVDPVDGTYKVIPEEYKDKINTKLKGTFYANSDGKVYYEHGRGLWYSDEEITDLINNHNFIPVATAEELHNVRRGDKLTYGKGTEWEDLYTGGLDENKKYVQVANIDLSGYSDWTPIGTGSAKFKGSFDGNGYKITGLTINMPKTNNVGLFGYTEGATISNAALENINVTGLSWLGGLVGYAEESTIENSYTTGSVTGSSRVGGLVGYATNSSKISNSYATGPVTGSSAYVGGLVGEANNGAISDSYFTGAVKSTGDYAGGLVGNTANSTIENSYTTGSVDGVMIVGGLAGWATNSTKISNSYTTGSVEGKARVGGLVGYAVSLTTISNSYATGSVTGLGIIGGLVGETYQAGIITNSYWNKETLTKSAGGEGKTADDMKKQTTYSGWDFVNVWEIDEGNDYPKLR